jgi:hypothetical protein
MNIFAVEEHPQEAARVLVDKHVVKMVLETTQMISTVAHARAYTAPYRSSHAKHPCTVWAGTHPSNMRWLFEHGFELCKEYTRRYDKVHASQKHLQMLWDDLYLWWPEVTNAPWQDHTTFAQAMPEQFRSSSPVLAYRSYYRVAKGHLAKWKISDRKPAWF